MSHPGTTHTGEDRSRPMRRDNRQPYIRATSAISHDGVSCNLTPGVSVQSAETLLLGESQRFEARSHWPESGHSMEMFYVLSGSPPSGPGFWILRRQDKGRHILPLPHPRSQILRVRIIHSEPSFWRSVFSVRLPIWCTHCTRYVRVY